MTVNASRNAAEVASTEVADPLKLAPLGELGPLPAVGQALPIFATLDGRAVAVLDLDLYRRLVLAAMDDPRPPRREKSSPAGPPLGLSTIERDPEVAEFLRVRFRGGVTVAQIRDACRNSFGEERTPSHARIQRFREALRRVR